MHHRRPKHSGLASKAIPKPNAEECAFIQSLLLFEDSDILVFNKPSGLAVQGGSGVTRDVDSLLWAFATRKGRRPKLVHRLDRETSGILVVAKTSPAAANLSRQFADHLTQKTYLALTCGVPDSEFGQIDVPLVRFNSGGIDLVRPASTGEAGSQLAQTDWKRLTVGPHAALIEAMPLSGRMHQIRAHLAAIGYPIAGDTKYGGLLMIGSVAVPRLMLHAACLRFTHPSSGAEIKFEAQPPETFQTICSQLLD